MVKPREAYSNYGERRRARSSAPSTSSSTSAGGCTSERGDGSARTRSTAAACGLHDARPDHAEGGLRRGHRDAEPARRPERGAGRHRRPGPGQGDDGRHRLRRRARSTWPPATRAAAAVGQPGSTFKPFALAEAVSEGYSIESRFQAPSQITFTRTHGGGTWKVRGGARRRRHRRSPRPPRSRSTPCTPSSWWSSAPRRSSTWPSRWAIEQRDGDLDAYRSLVLGTGRCRDGHGVRVLDLRQPGRPQVTDRRHPRRVGRRHRRSRFTPERAAGPHRRADRQGQLRPRQVVERRHRVEAADLRSPAGRQDRHDAEQRRRLVRRATRPSSPRRSGWATRAARARRVARLPVMNNVHGIEVQGGTFPAGCGRSSCSEVTRNTPPTDFPAFPPEVIEAGNLLHPELARPATTAPRYTAAADAAVDAGHVHAGDLHAAPRRRPPRRAAVGRQRERRRRGNGRATATVTAGGGGGRTATTGTAAGTATDRRRQARTSWGYWVRQTGTTARRRRPPARRRPRRRRPSVT